MISFETGVTVHPSLYKQQHTSNAEILLAALSFLEKMEKFSFVPGLNTYECANWSCGEPLGLSQPGCGHGWAGTGSRAFPQPEVKHGGCSRLLCKWGFALPG